MKYAIDPGITEIVRPNILEHDILSYSLCWQSLSIPTSIHVHVLYNLSMNVQLVVHIVADCGLKPQSSLKTLKDWLADAGLCSLNCCVKAQGKELAL